MSDSLRLRTLYIGPGRSGGAGQTNTVKIDLVNYEENPIDHVLDVAVHPIPYPDGEFDHVRAEHVLEHIPTQYRWFDGAEHHVRFCRVELMREIYRVLRPGGTLHASVPILPGNGWNQDPTHIGPPWSLLQFTYFCGEWGGNKPGHEATESSGINFAFEMARHFEEPRGVALTVILRKPQN